MVDRPRYPDRLMSFIGTDVVKVLVGDVVKVLVGLRRSGIRTRPACTDCDTSVTVMQVHNLGILRVW